MSMSIGGPRYTVAALPTDASTDTETPDPVETAKLTDQAAAFPAGNVQLERRGAKLGLQIPGGLAALAGTVLLGVSLLSHSSAPVSRLKIANLVVGGGLVALGASTVLGTSLIKPKSTYALATNIPTREKAMAVAATFARQTKIVEDVNKRFAVIDEGPLRTGGSGDTYYPGSGGYHYGGPGYYYPDGHYYPGHYPDPHYPGNGGYYDNRPPSYPYVPGGGWTSPGDDYPSSGGSSYPSGGTSSGDDYSPSYPSSGGSSSSGGTSSGDSGSSYDPPSYDPPSYDSGSSNDSSNDSSSNGDPSYDDF